jgi:hypothetical protein
MNEGEILLLCEGTNASLDLRIIDRVLAHHGIRARVIAAGNATGTGTMAPILGYPPKLVFELKDLDFAAVAPTIAPRKPRKLRWRRHEIENFITDPWVLTTTLQQLRQGDPPLDWISQAPEDEAGARRVLEEIARPLLAHHVGGTMWFERFCRSTQDNPTTFRRPSKEEINDLGWAGSLAREAERVVTGCQQLARDPLLDSTRIADDWNARVQAIEASDFIRSGRFLAVMEGKMLFHALHQRFVSWGAKKLTPSDLEDRLLEALLSSLGTSAEPADFRDLADHIKTQLA